MKYHYMEWSRGYPRRRLAPPPVRLVVGGALWFYVLVAPGAVLIVAAGVRPHAVFPASILWTCALSAGVAVAYTLALGFAFGRRALWMYVLAAAVMGTVALLGEYVLAWILVGSDTSGTEDNGAAVGGVFLAGPIAATLAVLLGVGAAVGRYWTAVVGLMRRESIRP